MYTFLNLTSTCFLARDVFPLQRENFHILIVFPLQGEYFVYNVVRGDSNDTKNTLSKQTDFI